MAARKKPKRDDPEQSERFRKAARKAEAEKSGDQFKSAIEKIVPMRKLKSSR